MTDLAGLANNAAQAMGLPVRSAAPAGNAYDYIVIGSGFAGTMSMLNFLEGVKASGKTARAALIEVGKSDERCGASRWTMAYLRLDKNNDFDEDWIKEMDLVSEGMTDREYCKKLAKEARPTMDYLLKHGVKFNHHDEQDVLLVSCMNCYG